MKEIVFLASVIRFVPDPVRNESVNIGIVVASQDGVGAVVTDPEGPFDRLSSWGNADASLRFVLRSLEGWQKGSRSSNSKADARPKLDFESLRQMCAESTGVVQFSSPMACYSASAKDLAGELLRRYVLPPAGVITVAGSSAGTARRR
jgi:hypothetical protein